MTLIDERALAIPDEIRTLSTLDDGNDTALPALLLPQEDVWVTEHETGLQFHADTPLEVWGPLTARLIRAGRKLEFALADAVNFGETRIKSRYGEKYAQWITETGYEKETIRRIAWVGRQVETVRRRTVLDFAHHSEVASLPPKIQDAVLDKAVENGWNRIETRDAAREARALIKQAERDLLPVPERVLQDCQLVVADARSLPLEDEVVDLIVTSPPYGVNKDGYEHGDIPPGDWQRFNVEWMREAHRVALPGCRFMLNVPMDTSPRPADPERGLPAVEARPTYAHALAAALRAGWEYRSTIVWHDDQRGKSVARGSVDSAATPNIITPVEMIVMLYKDFWSRSVPQDRPSDIRHEDWLAWTDGYWALPGESNPWEEYPAAFPESIPTRLIQLLSFPGDHVLDPFVGSGTSAVVAQRLGRRFTGVDISERAINAARRRVDQAH